MTLAEVIQLRHSVRRYLPRPLTSDQIDALTRSITRINSDGSLHFQLVTEEPKAFKGLLAYGVFSDVSNYLVVAGKKTESLDMNAGYYGEQLVLEAKTLGLDTCWAGLTYRKIPGTFSLRDDEKIVAYIALGYGAVPGKDHKRKSPVQVSNYAEGMPDWFLNGVKAAILAPTAVNQQKFYFEYLGTDSASGKGMVRASAGFSLVGYTKVDLGIARLHFELGAGTENFIWM